MRVATEEATTIKFNKVLVTNKGMLAVCWPSAIQPRPKQPIWCHVNPFTSRERIHKHMGHLDVCIVQKLFQPLHACISPRPLYCLNRNISFPLTKSRVIKYGSFHICDWCKLGGLDTSVPSCLLTYVSPSRLDDNGTPTASLLFNLGHAFPGFLVGVICCTYCNLVLDPTQTIQLNTAFTTKVKRKP